MNSEPPEKLSQAADATTEPNLLRWRAYCVCRFVDGQFFNSELVDFEVAQAAFDQMSAEQRATSVLMPITVTMPKEVALAFVEQTFKRRIDYINQVRESN